MTRLDTEWIQVNLAYDVLQRTGDSTEVDESELHMETVGNPSWNNGHGFWNTLNLTREIVFDPKHVAVGEAPSVI